MVCPEPIDWCNVGEVAGPLVAVCGQIDGVAQHGCVVGIADSGQGLAYDKVY